MAVVLYRRRDGSLEEILRMDTIQNLSIDIKGNVMDIPIPDEKDAMIMSLGGVSRSVNLTWELVSRDIVKDIVKLSFDILDGTMFNDFVIKIEEWGIEKECVISSIRISQNAGEVNKFVVSMTLLMGEAIM